MTESSPGGGPAALGTRWQTTLWQETPGMREVRACGLIVFRREPELSFLLMRKPGRWDVPKGHVDPGESDVQCALRELEEETGIAAGDVELDQDFLFQAQYPIADKRDPGQQVLKTVRLYLAWLKRDVPIRLSEHVDFEWVRWNPPHQIQPHTIDPLLAEVAEYLK